MNRQSGKIEKLVHVYMADGQLFNTVNLYSAVLEKFRFWKKNFKFKVSRLCLLTKAGTPEFNESVEKK